MTYTKNQIAAIMQELTVIPERDMEERYNESLNEGYGTVKIAGLEYETADALKSVDPVAYRCGYADYASSEIGETVEEIGGFYYDKTEVDDLIDSMEETEIHTWFERDNAHVELRYTYTQETIIEWRDDDVRQALEDGFLDSSDWHGSALEYAESHDLIKK